MTTRIILFCLLIVQVSCQVYKIRRVEKVPLLKKQREQISELSDKVNGKVDMLKEMDRKILEEETRFRIENERLDYWPIYASSLAALIDLICAE